MTELEKYNKTKELILTGRKNRNIAKKLLAEMKDFPPAQFLLAVLLKGNRKINSKKINSLFISSLPYYQQTTENDEPERQVRLACYYYFGDMGVKQNLQEAVKWFFLAANGGNSQAQLFLSKCYANGYSIEKDIEKSIYWLEKAAEQGNSEALTTLGHCYVKGLYVNKDLVKGAELLSKAINLGNKRALKLFRCLIILNEIKK